MRKFSLDYSAALSLARESRPLLTPNPGFEDQLRIWQFCNYDIYLSDDSTASDSSSPKPKPAYKAWMSKRDAMFAKGEEAINKARFASMASLAASFGKKRIEEKEEGDREEQIESSNKFDQKQKAWEIVEQMEQMWTRRLIAGASPPWSEKEKRDDKTES
jgi:hypothetical protein